MLLKNSVYADVPLGAKRKQLFKEQRILSRTFFLQSGIDRFLGHPEFNSQLPDVRIHVFGQDVGEDTLQ
ncbi:MAG: hypothetical protein IJH64_04035 [Oscillospiraceae bacterium]|nr:hypothetical protein [Oscillospiraceae bacterium]